MSGWSLYIVTVVAGCIGYELAHGPHPGSHTHMPCGHHGCLVLQQGHMVLAPISACPINSDVGWQAPCGIRMMCPDSMGAFSHSARTAPIITVIIQVTTLKTTHLRNHAQSIQNSKIQTSNACHGSQGPKFCPL